MSKHLKLTVLILMMSLIPNFQATATEPREITWDDLVPAEAEFDDPFAELDENTLFNLSLVVQMREWITEGEQIEGEQMNIHKRRVSELERKGVDIDGMIALRDETIKERIAKSYLANEELNDKPVRIPGYVLPLEFDGEKVTEFFLVPYVGACIHTPPPPPNQIVHVETEEGYVTDGGLYTPVWVSGTMRSEQSKTDLNLVDGSSDIPSSYALDATSVKPYE